ncbi:MAG: hypothetical protein JNL93_23700 [Pelomonas sp.]|nr:hypothetical protein [Roseateles sp.]
MAVLTVPTGAVVVTRDTAAGFAVVPAPLVVDVLVWVDVPVVVVAVLTSVVAAAILAVGAGVAVAVVVAAVEGSTAEAADTVASAALAALAGEAALAAPMMLPVAATAASMSVDCALGSLPDDPPPHAVKARAASSMLLNG